MMITDENPYRKDFPLSAEEKADLSGQCGHGPAAGLCVMEAETAVL